MATGSKLRVVIVGGGFGGISAAKHLSDSRIEVTLIDRTNYHLFQPLLYQVATAALSPGDIAQPIRAILRGRSNVRVVMDTVKAIDAASNIVRGKLGNYEYDHLILSPGSRHAYFGKPDWEAHAPGLKTVEDALHIRKQLLQTFEAADRISNPMHHAELLTFVVVGGGPTGVEMAGAIAEISMRTMLPDFPRINRNSVRVVLVEASDRLLSSFDEKLSAHAIRSLAQLGVEVMLSTRVTDIQPHAITLQAANTIVVNTANVIWAAGNAASPLLLDLHAEVDRNGRILVNKNCSVPNWPNIYVIGDCAHFEQGTGTLPGVAQTATQMGRYVATELVKLANGKHAFVRDFTYKDLGSMATIGRARAVADVFGLKLAGFPAWTAWAVLHILKLISFRNKLKVLVEWLWYYVSFQPGARLLYGSNEQHQQPTHESQS